MSNSKTTTVTLSQSKQTKRTVVYTLPENDYGVCESVYLQKRELQETFGGFPDKVKLTIEKV